MSMDWTHFSNPITARSGRVLLAIALTHHEYDRYANALRQFKIRAALPAFSVGAKEDIDRLEVESTRALSSRKWHEKVGDAWWFAFKDDPELLRQPPTLIDLSLGTWKERRAL